MKVKKMKKSKMTFTCELKKDINNLIEYHKKLLEETHKNFYCIIDDVKFKHLNIGLIKVDFSYTLVSL